MPVWAYSTSMGELKSVNTRFENRIARHLPQDHIPFSF
jgi:hypothetical protein